ncbi:MULTISPECIES: virulence factor Mce family protein [Mycobacterium]|uniref:Virulence factor Mce family protein n=1 Tax=Mycobacterium intracellulare subsp. chimaera TaxID=222805 RepID=A0ABT7P9K8_MYCIT|nr:MULTISPECIES: virulence factor Mce family protein [Mycobacterium]AGP63699.1 virulence factor mce family protein [Mycobacterium intracellulare subsp. yongonense 05-1390]ARR77818.1 virulence factor mce family protein [Mycobacterium intracellulare subsp. yongonense]ARR82925.1 virulence factor mce family protein [Mycobacterium intracellulare subsp. yongonense]ASQ86174.1 mammalian cell entry protein [Mycobacterium intracellulare subsp. chimaera]ASX00414.1 mammalian cell entry protein [Mycobacter
MSTVFDIRKIQLPKFSRTAIIVGTLVILLASIAALAAPDFYQKMTNNTVIAYFPEANALYIGDKVQIMGVRVGAIDKIEPSGDKMKVTFHYEKKYKVPADASAVILNPSLVASRTIQLEPPYEGGPSLGNHAVIPIERTQVPVEWDQLRNGITDIISKLGPTPGQPKGPFGEIIESFADGLAGKGKQINSTLTGLSQALTALNDGRADFFAVLRSMALFVNALYKDDQNFVALNKDLALFTSSLTSSDPGLAKALQQVDDMLPALRKLLTDNRDGLTHDVSTLADVTTALVQPEPLNALETALHVFPHFVANALAIYEPAHGALTGEIALPNFANPLQFICSAMQAGSRMGYQDSAELCAQYLTPVLDAIKFNGPPAGINLYQTPAVLPKHVAYSEPRLQPPPGFKDTTVPGIWAPDSPLSHGNHEPGWVVAPGEQGLTVGPATESLLTPDSLAELMGGPDMTPPPSRFQTPPGPPNAYSNMGPPPPGPPPAADAASVATGSGQ